MPHKNIFNLAPSEVSFYESIYEIDVSIIILNKKAEIAMANKAASKFLGYSLSELSNMTLLDIDSTLSLEKLQKFLKPASIDLPIIFTHDLNRKNAKKTPFEATIKQQKIGGKKYFVLVLKNFSKFSRSNTFLSHELKLEKLITSVGSILIDSKKDTFVFDNLVKIIGKFFKTDSCYLIEYGKEDNEVFKLHRWNALKQKTDKRAKFKNLTDLIPWSRSELINYTYIKISNLKLEEYDDPKFNCLRKRNVKSIIQFPIIVNKKLSAILGLEMFEEERIWDKNIIQFTMIVTEMLLSYMTKKEYVVKLEEYSEKMDEIFKQSIIAMTVLTEFSDPYTVGHQRNVAKLSTAIAHHLKLESSLIQNIDIAAKIHDIGKVAIPLAILSKPGKLLDEEYALIKVHPRIGFDISKNIKLPAIIGEIIMNHHERLDGSGYPHGLKGDEISLAVRVVSVADTVEAMSNRRPYRSARGIDTALKEIIKEADNNKLDKKVVNACLKIFDQGFEFNKY